MKLPKRLQCSLTDVVNLGHIQTYASVLSNVELITYLEEDREKYDVQCFTPVSSYLLPHLSMYAYIT